MRIVVSGASGFLGSALVPRLGRAGHEVLRLVRRAARAADEIAWDPAAGALDRRRLDGVDAAFHLSGATLARRWTPARKREIWSSRVDTTRLIAERLAQLEPRPRVLVAVSAIGYYGDRGDEALDESSPPGRGFLADLCAAWEAAADPARAAGIRVVHPRLGLVLARGEGVLARLVPVFRLGLGGPVGDGRAWWSWIAIDDLLDVFERLVGEAWAGPVDVVAPHPVRNAEFARTLARVLRRPAWMPVPGLALRLAYGEMADAALLASARASPRRLEAAGHAFRHPDLDGALRAALSGGT